MWMPRRLLSDDKLSKQQKTHCVNKPHYGVEQNKYDRYKKHKKIKVKLLAKLKPGQKPNESWHKQNPSPR